MPLPTTHRIQLVVVVMRVEWKWILSVSVVTRVVNFPFSPFAVPEKSSLRAGDQSPLPNGFVDW
jgi:hypothetical protein